MVTVYDIREERSVMNMLEACGDPRWRLHQTIGPP